MWSSDVKKTDVARHASIGLSAQVPGICGNKKFSILEFNGFFAIQNGAHELGHMLVFFFYFVNFLVICFYYSSLGAVHDGTIYNNINATMCPAKANNIMTPVTGAFYNANAMFYFSNCSIAAFKSTLLTPDMKLIFILLVDLSLFINIYFIKGAYRSRQLLI